MPVKSLKRNLLKFAGVGTACSIVIIIGVLIYLPDYTKIQELRRKKTAVRREIVVLRKEVTDLNKKNKLVKNNDPYFLEKLAREHLGMIKEDEAVVDITAPQQKR